ncbi:MAG: hypothetical protein K0V04_36145 [Deltaproteobacteria bacterium]|nr:hypothetical protein [Deltaproteobacteria bacterium]
MGQCVREVEVPAGPSTASPPSAAAPVEVSPRHAEGPTQAPKQVWSVDLGAVVYARPTLATDGQGRTVAYVGSHSGHFVGVVVDGAQAGTVVLEHWVDGIIWSTALVDEHGRVLFGADDDHLYAIDTVSGQLAWRTRLGECEPTRAPGPEGMRCDVDGGPSLGPDGDVYVGADGLYRVGDDGEVR